mmetsp:Transcript_18196/g.51827  ORF Transcript_18196/g.51827 Transcript_18196/m.51827 type:complete len:216 (+) Transcript_18196:66-713(+)
MCGTRSCGAGSSRRPPSELQAAAFATDRLLDDFLEAIRIEDPSAAPAPWQKVGISIFDEEAILGPPAASDQAATADWIDEILDDLEQTPGWYDDDSEDDDYSYDDYSGDDATNEVDQVAAEFSHGKLPRIASQALAFCCAYRLPGDLPDCCPICLEDLRQGEDAWRLPCTHVFHAACTVQSFRLRSARLACPLCRCDIRRAAVASPDDVAALAFE